MRIICLALFLFQTSIAFPSGEYYRTLADVKARFMGMGGAYVAVPSGVSSIIYNPAALSKQQKFSSHFNFPVATVFAEESTKFMKYFQDTEQRKGETKVEYKERMERRRQERELTGIFIGMVAGLRGGLSYSKPKYFLGYNLLEELLVDEDKNYPTGEFFNTQGVKENYFHTFSGGYRLNSQTSIGGAIYDIHQKTYAQKQTGIGWSFGIYQTLNPGLSAGILYMNFPNETPGIRSRLERFEEDTWNAGFSYQLKPDILLAFDLRDILDNSSASMEPHIGVEHLLDGKTALRAGYYHDRFLKTDVLTAGIGSLIFNSKYRSENIPEKHLLNYSFVHEKSSGKTFHFLSFGAPF